MSYVNINCKKCSEASICYHPKVKPNRFLFFKFRPLCKLAQGFYKETILENGDVIRDDKCKYQTKYPKPILPSIEMRKEGRIK